ncbi:hypothetical protein HD554DRAFT_2040569 [Boletus coccyginus]|nr:hypothetical protein HD554DRAFT_2040569 [Boletus coccyginus]
MGNILSQPPSFIRKIIELKPELLEKWIALDDFLTNVFHKPRQTEKATHGVTSPALHCFQHFISLVSWTISRYPEEIDQSNPWWVKVLLDKWFPPAMVKMLRDSLAETFSPITSRAHVPIYIIWDHCNKQGKQDFQDLPLADLIGKWIRENYYPSDDDIVQVITVADRQSISQQPLPNPLHGSHQKKGETWQNFFTHQKIFNKEKEACHSMASKIWALYPGSWKCYDPFMDKWDICTEFDPSAPTEYDMPKIDLNGDGDGQHIHAILQCIRA